MKRRQSRPSSGSNQRSRYSSAGEPGVRKKKKPSSQRKNGKKAHNSVSNNYFINNVNIGNLKNRISSNLSENYSLFLDLRRKMVQKKIKDLKKGHSELQGAHQRVGGPMQGQGLGEGVVSGGGGERREPKFGNRERGPISKGYRHKKSNSHSYNIPGGPPTKEKMQSTDLTKLLSKSKKNLDNYFSSKK